MIGCAALLMQPQTATVLAPTQASCSLALTARTARPILDSGCHTVVSCCHYMTNETIIRGHALLSVHAIITSKLNGRAPSAISLAQLRIDDLTYTQAYTRQCTI
jgi:hypothetical protein